MRTNPYLVLPYVESNMFPPEMCDKIISHGLKHWREHEGKIGDEGDLVNGIYKNIEYRQALCREPGHGHGEGNDFENNFIKTLLDRIFEHNNSEHGYNFDLFGPHEAPMLLEYKNVDGHPGQYKAHLDIGKTFPTSNRKLSYSVHLNYGEYEGGELEFRPWEDWTPLSIEGKLQKGMMVLFPSYLLHRVTPVTKGIRYSLTGWVHGDAFQ